MDIGSRIGDVALRTPDGRDLTLQHYLDRPLVVAMPRYYG